MNKPLLLSLCFLLISPASAQDEPPLEIAFVAERDGNAEIMLIDVNGANVRNLSNTDSANEYIPIFSPDGEEIAFISDRDGNFEIYIMNLDSSDVRRLTDNPALDEVTDVNGLLPAPGCEARPFARLARSGFLRTSLGLLLR